MLSFTLTFSILTGAYYIGRLWLQHQQRMDNLKMQYHQEMRRRRDQGRGPKGFKRWYNKHINMEGD